MDPKDKYKKSAAVIGAAFGKKPATPEPEEASGEDESFASRVSKGLVALRKKGMPGAPKQER